MVQNSDFCNLWCTQKIIEIPPKEHLKIGDLILGKERDRTLYFSIVGNKPKNPVVALVGICSGSNQLEKFISCYKDGLTVQNSAIESGFSKLSKNLRDMLNVLGVDKIIQEEISSDYNLNHSEKFLITSLVKCASLRDGKKPSQSFDPSTFEMTKRCVINRFIPDILNPDFTNLKLIFIMGNDGWSAINTISIHNTSIKGYLESKGKVLVQIPHPSGNNIRTIQKFLKDPEYPMRIVAIKKLANFT